MLKKILCLILLLFSFFEAQTQIFNLKELHISITPTISFTMGNLGESLYYSKYYDSSKKRSHLEWEKNLFMAGLGLELSFKNFCFELSGASSLFDKDFGDMKDSDWLNTSDYAMKTTYSIGEIASTENYELTTNISYELNTTDWLLFSPMIQLQYNYDSFERSDSEGWYSSDNLHWWYDETSIHYPKTYWNGSKYVTAKLGEIDMYRHSLHTWIGVKTKIKPFSKVHFDFTILLSPFSYFYSIDTHYAKNSETKEMYGKHYRMIQLSNFNMLYFSLKAIYKVNKIFDLSLKGIYYFTFESAKGTCFVDFNNYGPQNYYYNTKQDSGASVQNFTIQLGCKIKIC